ncbi:MAG: sugar O-acetyltransferase [Candidatus Methanoplasma sp.]|jgi:maltose O-acetyltransferase|nr:sugar O-acetyltransferase [Candidatus Methanoplasma sp.]
MDGKTVWDLMGTGEEWGPDTPGIDEFNRANLACSNMLIRYNSTPMAPEGRRALLSEILGKPVDPGTKVVPPFSCDLGRNITLGRGVLINYGCALLDCAEIRIGDHVLIGPGVNIVTADHPMDHVKRRSWITSSRPVEIGDDVWIGAGATIKSGVTVGARAVIGAGSVVVRDVPPDAVSAGNPARILRAAGPSGGA